MDTHTQNDPNNPINFKGEEIESCNLCGEDLTEEDREEEHQFCEECFYSCCGDELDQDIRICPTCREHN
jgi:hypothetical protein